MRRYLPVFLIMAVVIAVAQSNAPTKVEIPALSTERDQFGARPGTFHFVTNEQAIADAVEMKRAFEALDRLEAATTGKSESAKMAEDLRVVRAFATNVQRERTSSAGDSAKAIEARLNAAKGNFMCGACHGPGMMHQMMQGPPSR